MPNLRGPLVVALLYDGLCTFEFGIAAEIFGLARPEMGPEWYRFASAAVEPGPLRAHGGFSIHADGGVDLLNEADLIIVPGWKGAEVSVPTDLLAQLKRAHVRGARLASICSGAFVLAATGLLDGGVATTHWRYAGAMRRQFPRVTVDESSLYRGADQIFTSAGSAAGIDLLIEIVRQDFGPEAANSVARRIAMPAGSVSGMPRPEATRYGGRSPARSDQARLAQAVASIRTGARGENEQAHVRAPVLRGDRNIPGEMAYRRTGRSGQTHPVGDRPTLVEVAETVGISSAHALRHHFRRCMKLSPSGYRQSFAKGKRPPM